MQIWIIRTPGVDGFMGGTPIGAVGHDSTQLNSTQLKFNKQLCGQSGQIAM